jgi:hypothetical protein
MIAKLTRLAKHPGPHVVVVLVVFELIAINRRQKSN